MTGTLRAAGRQLTACWVACIRVASTVPTMRFDPGRYDCKAASPDGGCVTTSCASLSGCSGFAAAAPLGQLGAGHELNGRGRSRGTIDVTGRIVR